MLRTKVGYSINEDSFTAGEMATKNALIGNSSKIGFLFTSCKSNVKEVVKGVKNLTDTPIIGCTSSGAVIVPDGIVASENGYAAMMTLADVNLTVGLASHEAGKNARQIGRKVALEAVKNAGTTVAPNYFYMIASPKEEEEYLMGIQDVIGRVPFFGGSAADDSVQGKWKIICNDKVFSDGVAVAFFYTTSDIVTEYTGSYHDTSNKGIITEVNEDRTLVTIDGEKSLEKYSTWVQKTPEELRGTNLLVSSILKPLGIKDQIGNLTLIRHPMIGNTNNTMNLGNKVVDGTAVIQMETTVEELINSTGETLKKVRKKLLTEPSGYILIHSGGRKLGIGNRLEEVHKQLVKESKGIPFIVVFTFGEYGYSENSSNSCGGLMLSFTGFGKE
ncbi:MAG: FIST C-terminal domain-containing protein [Bacilli bacterium]|nr:FIST C-terminal domain-containing protein [Bacilli bacterium]